MRIISFFPLLLLFAAPFQTQAQGLKKGFIVTMNGDTLQGFIEDGSYELLSKQIRFKSNKKDKTSIVYNPNEIRSFQFSDGDFFVSNMAYYSSTHTKGSSGDVHEMRFLHRLYHNDKTSLYELNDWEDRPLFVQKNKEAITLLCIDQNGNPAYLEVLAYLVNDCEPLVIPGDLPLNAKAIEAILVEYDQCGKIGNPAQKLPQMMVWAGVGVPTLSLARKYDGLGQTFQLELRPFSEGFLSNIDIGVEYFNFNSTNKTQYQDYEYRKHTKQQELSIKSRFFLNAWNGHLRPYGFLALTSYTSEYNSSYRYYYSQQFTTDHSRSEFTKLSFHPGIGLHGQWKRHIFRVELPLTDELAFPRIGYGYAF